MDKVSNCPRQTRHQTKGTLEMMIETAKQAVVPTGVVRALEKAVDCLGIRREPTKPIGGRRAMLPWCERNARRLQRSEPRKVPRRQQRRSMLPTNKRRKLLSTSLDKVMLERSPRENFCRRRHAVVKQLLSALEGSQVTEMIGSSRQVV